MNVSLILKIIFYSNENNRFITGFGGIVMCHV